MRLIDADQLPRQKQLEAMGNGEYIEVEIVRGVDIDNAPTVEVEEVKHGKWIDYPDCLAYEGAISHEDFVCSECASVWNAIDNESDRFDYCPNCGAKMEETE